jgi:hypothetical protein
MLVTGDFADQQGVPLPASYLTFQTMDPTVATVTSTGQISAVGLGSTVLIISSHGIQAATVLNVDDPTADDPPEYYGLEVYPQGIAMPVGGTRQLQVELDQQVDVTAGSTGTLYFTSNPNVVQVSADGLVTTLGVGTATVTVIAANQEEVVPVQVESPPPGPRTIGTAGGVVQGSDGSLIQLAPGALSSTTTVSIAPASLDTLPIGPPNGFHFVGAEQISLGGQSLAQPALLTTPVPQGIPAGEKVYVYLETTLPDDTGTDVPVWQEVDVGVVGADGFVRTGTLPYQGILSEGTYVFAVANDPTQVAQVSVTLAPSSFAGAVGASYAMVDPFGFNPLVAILPYLFVTPTFYLDMPTGVHNIQLEAIPVSGLPSLTTIPLTVTTGDNSSTQAITPLPANNAQPVIQTAVVNVAPGQAPVLVLTGANFGTTAGNLQVSFQMRTGATLLDDVDSKATTLAVDYAPALGPVAGRVIAIGDEQMLIKTVTVVNGSDGKPSSWILTVQRGYNGTSTDSHSADAMVAGVIPGTILQVAGNQASVSVPQTVTLGLAQIILTRTITNKKGQVLQTLPSEPVQEVALGGYLFTALPGLGQVAVVDTKGTTASSANFNVNTLIARISVSAANGAGVSRTGFPQYVAVTPDNTRAYVTDVVNHGIAVIDTVALQQVNIDPTKQGINEIGGLPSNAAPYEITIDPDGEYAYVSDESEPIVYVIDVDPLSPKYNQLVDVINVDDPSNSVVKAIGANPAPLGLRGLAVNSDASQLFVAAPNMLPSENAPKLLPVGHILVIDLTPQPGGYPDWKLVSSVDAGQDPYGVTAGPDDAITFTDYLFNNQSLGLIQPGSPTATFTEFDFSANINDEFEVNNARAVAVTPDGKYAFVAGYDIPDENDPSHNQGIPAFNPAGSNIGIVANPFGDPTLAAATGFGVPTLVAATRSIPEGFPYDVTVSPDGRYLYATFPSIPVKDPTTGQQSDGAVMVYDINEIIKTLTATSPDLLKRVGIDALDPAIDVHADYQLPPNVQYNPKLIDTPAPPFVTLDPKKAPIATGGIPHGLAIQDSPVVVHAQGNFRDVIQVNLKNALVQALGTPGTYTNFQLLIPSFTNGMVAIDPTKKLSDAKEGDILEAKGADAFTQSGVFWFIPNLNVDAIQQGEKLDPLIALGNFTYDVTARAGSRRKVRVWSRLISRTVTPR